MLASAAAREVLGQPTKVIEALSREYVATHGFDPKRVYTLRARSPKMVTVLGPIDWIAYVTKKKFEGDETFTFVHDFEGRKKPWLAAGGGDYFVLGGGYTIIRHGIDDDSGDSRELPSARRFMADLSLPPRLVGMGRMHSIGYAGTKEIRMDRGSRILAYDRRGRGAVLWIVRPRREATLRRRPA